MSKKKVTIDDYRAAAVNGFAEYLKRIPDGQIYKFVKGFEDDFGCHPLFTARDEAIHFSCENCMKAHKGLCVDDEMQTFRLAGNTIYGATEEDPKKDLEWETFERKRPGLRDAEVVILTQDEYKYAFGGIFLCEPLFLNFYDKGFTHEMKGKYVVFDQAEIEERLRIFRSSDDKESLLHEIGNDYYSMV